MRAFGSRAGIFAQAARAVLTVSQRVCGPGVSSLAVFAVAAALGVTPARAEDAAALRITAASVPAADKTGGDIPLALTIVNDAAEADALLRVSCPFVNFAEKHTTDRGEGAPSMRVIRALPIPPKATTDLNGEGNHVMLLQVRQKLAAGEKLGCSVTFQRAGKLEVEVEVRGAP